MELQFVDKTNALGFELYAVLGQIDGSSYSMAYLFLDNAKKDDRVQTVILAKFFKQLYDHGLQNAEFFLTDKDRAQINTAQQTWPSIKIQLCLWHLKRAVKKRLDNTSIPQRTSYNSQLASIQTGFIDPNFHPFATTNEDLSNQWFCPREFRETILDKIAYHFHLHPLIPNDENEFLTSDELWLLFVRELYDFCVQHDLKHVWAYMWVNWYKKEDWVLWTRAANSEKICLFKTTVLIEAHWKVIKRKFLPKF